MSISVAREAGREEKGVVLRERCEEGSSFVVPPATLATPADPPQGLSGALSRG